MRQRHMGFNTTNFKKNIEKKQQTTEEQQQPKSPACTSPYKQTSAKDLNIEHMEAIGKKTNGETRVKTRQKPKQ